MTKSRTAGNSWLLGLLPENYVLMNAADAAKRGLNNGESVRVVSATNTAGEWDLGNGNKRPMTGKLKVVQGIRPGVVACSHHLGRWRLQESAGGERWSTALVDLTQEAPGKWRLRQIHGVRPFESDDPDSQRVWWQEAGVHQNLTHAVHPDPVSGQHVCWHQKARVSRPGPEDRYGDVFVDPTGRMRCIVAGSR